MRVAAVLVGLVLVAAQPPAPDPEKVKAWEKAAAESDRAKDLYSSVAAWEKQLAAARAAFPPADDRVQFALNTLAGLYLDADNAAAARRLRAELHDTRLRAYGDKDFRTVDARIGLAFVDRLGQLGDDDRVALIGAGGRMRRAETLLGNGLFLDALAEAEFVLHTRSSLLGPDHSYTALAYNLVAQVWQSGGHLAPAEAAHRAALRSWRAAIPHPHPTTYTLINNLAVLYLDAGQYSRAEPLLLEARDAARAFGGDANPSYAQALGNLGNLYKQTARFAQAEALVRESIELRRKLGGDGSPDHRHGLGTLAGLYVELGDLARADEVYARIDGYLLAAKADRTPEYAQLLFNRAVVPWTRRDYAAARALQTRAADLAADVLGENHRETILYRAGLGVTLTELGEYAAAETLIRRAVEAFARNPETRDYATALNQLAYWCAATGRLDEDRKLLAESEALRARMFGRGHPAHLLALTNLAQYYRKAGNPEAAVERFHEFFALAGRFVELAAAAQSEAWQLNFAADRGKYLGAYLSTAPAAGVPADEEYAHVLAHKGGVLVRQRPIAAFRRQAAARPHAWVSGVMAERAAVNRDLLKAALSPPAAAGRAAWQQRLRELQTKQTEIEAALSQIGADYRARLGRPLPDAAAVGKALPAGTTFVDYVGYLHNTPPMTGVVRPAEERLVAYVVRPGGEVKRVELGAAAAVENAVTAWRDRYAADPPGKVAGDPGADLRRLVWEPVAKHLGDAKTVLVSPDGPLTALPFAALPGEKAGTFLIEDGFTFATVPVPQLLPEMTAARGKEAAPSLLLVGDVDFGPADRGPMFQPLPGTELELASVGRRSERAFPGTKATAQDRAAATKAAFVADAGKHRFLHLATHGYFEAPRAVAAARGARPGPGIAPEAAAENPGLLSGVVFAGVNAAEPAAVAAATLTAAEVAQLDLGGADLVVLSACDTGRGRVAVGEGVLGLQRGFQVAGARAVVATLWPIPDRQSAELMAGFYEHLWEKKLPPAEALRQAQLARLRAARARNLGRGVDAPPPPYEWAGFVLSGDWR